MAETAEISEYIDHFVSKEIALEDEKTDIFVEEEKISTDIVCSEEATPCFLEDFSPATPNGMIFATVSFFKFNLI